MYTVAIIVVAYSNAQFVVIRHSIADEVHEQLALLLRHAFSLVLLLSCCLTLHFLSPLSAFILYTFIYITSHIFSKVQALSSFILCCCLFFVCVFCCVPCHIILRLSNFEKKRNVFQECLFVPFRCLMRFVLTVSFIRSLGTQSTSTNTSTSYFNVAFVALGISMQFFVSSRPPMCMKATISVSESYFSFTHILHSNECEGGKIKQIEYFYFWARKKNTFFHVVSLFATIFAMTFNSITQTTNVPIHDLNLL